MPYLHFGLSFLDPMILCQLVAYLSTHCTFATPSRGARIMARSGNEGSGLAKHSMISCNDFKCFCSCYLSVMFSFFLFGCIALFLWFACTFVCLWRSSSNKRLFSASILWLSYSSHGICCGTQPRRGTPPASPREPLVDCFQVPT